MEYSEPGRGALPTARLEQRGAGNQLRRAGRDLGTWSAHRVRAVGYIAGKIAPALLTATFVGAVSVGLAVLTDSSSSSRHDFDWQQYDFSQLQRTLEMSERIRLNNDAIRPLLDSMAADRMLQEQESRWAPPTFRHPPTRLVIESGFASQPSIRLPEAALFEPGIPGAGLLDGSLPVIPAPGAQFPEVHRADLKNLELAPRRFDRLPDPSP